MRVNGIRATMTTTFDDNDDNVLYCNICLRVCWLGGDNVNATAILWILLLAEQRRNTNRPIKEKDTRRPWSRYVCSSCFVYMLINTNRSIIF